MSTTATPAINFDEIKSKISQLTPAQKAEKLAKFRERQLFQQKKQAAKGGQAAYNKRRNAEFKLMREEAMATPANDPQYKNLWEEIEAQAQAGAETKFDEYIDSQTEGDGTEGDEQ